MGMTYVQKLLARACGRDTVAVGDILELPVSLAMSHENASLVSKTFRKIPGVLDVRAGQVVPSDREIVDDSFDVGIIVTVPDRRRLAEYLTHPVHQKARDDILLPLVGKIVVYDFIE